MSVQWHVALGSPRQYGCLMAPPLQNVGRDLYIASMPPGNAMVWDG